MNPIRIALVAPSLDLLGGQAVQASLLMDRLNQLPDLEVEFIPINPRMPGPLRELQKVRFVRTVVTTLGYVGSLLARLRSFDVVHVFSASYFSFFLAPTPALVVAKAFGRPTVLNYRSGEADDHLTRWRTAPPTIRLATRVVTPSEYLVDVFGKHSLTASSIPNFVDLETFRWRERDPLRPVFLSNRNFEAHYDVATVLRAFAVIQAQWPSARLLVAGDGPQRQELHALAERLGLEQVEFMGQVEHTRMPQLYDQSDIYLNAPYIDNMPNSILEAYACGLPVVTSDAGGIPYIVRDRETGLLVPPRDPGALAEAALRLLSDPKLAAALAAGGRREVQERYTFSSVRNQWLELYRELSGGKGEKA
ncbi:MAG: glycosyltransferase family 4 protein [Gemmatimonadetes bacterium]|nr:glycosyltransferase family 4 protein [Gemmatimonadota bacterium]NNM04255.1 glycosyltransferase family 4 protein [Gemmatimonadota bacterium]